jgi:molybdopterin molybdotransferase
MPDLDHQIRSTSLADALAAIRAQLSSIVGQETVPLSQARSRILARDLVADVDLPQSDNSAVDGFAMREDDLAADEIVKLTLIGEAAAGRPFRGVVERGQAIRILTGAPLPVGANVIVMQEWRATDGKTVEILNHVRGKTNWRRRGEDVKMNALTLPAGRRLRAKDAALAGALGHKELTVFKRLQVGLFSTGNELCEPGEPLKRGQIWDVNRCLLRGLLEQIDCDVQDLGIIRDDPRALEGTLSRAASNADLLITSGGMSVGSEDHMRTIIRRRGTLDVWRIAIKPGKPVGLGDIDACPILALPGNPVAAVVAFTALGKTVANRLSGASEEPPVAFVLRAGFTFEKQKGLRQYLLADVSRRPGGTTMALPRAKQGSAMLSAMAESSGLIVLEEECERVEVDDPITFMPLNTLFG